MNLPVCPLCPQGVGRGSKDAEASRTTLCQTDSGEVLWRDAFCRVVLADEPDYPGFLRVILNAHVKEMTDLTHADQTALMRVVFAAEAALREVMQPDKINLASLGNVVPHLHWHVIPRFSDDPHFPNPVWGQKTGQGKPHVAPERTQREEALDPQGAGRVPENAEALKDADPLRAEARARSYAFRTSLNRRLAPAPETE